MRNMNAAGSFNNHGALIEFVLSFPVDFLRLLRRRCGGRIATIRTRNAVLSVQGS